MPGLFDQIHKFINTPRLRRPRTFEYNPNEVFTALDIGTEYVKALIFQTENGTGRIIGVGRSQQGLNDMREGIVTDIPSVVSNCDHALKEAEQMAGVTAPNVVIGIAGEMVRGNAVTISRERSDPTTPIRAEELEEIISSGQQESAKKAANQISWETGFTSIDVRLINTSIISTRIDGHQIHNPIGFQGKNFSITLFSAFTTLTQLSSLETVAANLDMDLLAVVAEPYAVARAMEDSIIDKYGAIFIDIGGGTTDLALVRNNGVESTKMFATGGRNFTQCISKEKHLSYSRAEALKILYSQGKLPVEETEEIRSLFSQPIQTWIEGIEISLGEMSKNRPLPPYIYICGGGSTLPDISAALKAYPWKNKLEFMQNPAIEMLHPRDVTGIEDQTGLLTNQQDITPMSLAYQAIELQQDTGPLEESLYNVLRELKM